MTGSHAIAYLILQDGCDFYRNSIARGQPLQDSEQNVESTSVSFNNNITTVRFSRARCTEDVNDFSLNVCRYFLFAWGNVTNIKTGEIGSYCDGMGQTFISDDLICLPISTSVCPEECKLLY